MDSKPVVTPGSFTGRVIIVTGGAGAIGRELCHAFAAAGGSVVVNDLGGEASGDGSSPGPAEDVAAAIRKMGHKAVADSHSVVDADHIVDTAIREFGRVDVLINNAGIIAYKPFQDQKPADMKRTLEVNVLGPMLLSHRLWPLFRAQNYGRIVNITSTLAYGYPSAGPYSTSKGGIWALTKALAAEVGDHDIKVNAIAPCASTRMALPGLKEEERESFTQTFPVVGNIPMIVALATEKFDLNGEVFSTANYKVNRLLFAIAPGVRDAHSVEQLQEMEKILVDPHQDLAPMRSTTDFVKWISSHAQDAKL